MKKIKVLINGITVHDSFDKSNLNVLNCEIEKINQDYVDNCNLNILRTVYNLVDLRPSQVVEIWSGDLSATKREFYGFISDIKPRGGIIEIECEAETRSLLRRIINQVFTSDEAHMGKTHLIVKELIEYCGLTASVVDSGKIIDEFKCIHANVFERIIALMKSDDFQLRYNSHERIVYYEPRGFNDTEIILETKDNILGLPEWDENTDGMINSLRIDGATTETQKKETGIIGTDEGFTTGYIELQEKPNIVELIIDGTQYLGGTKDATAGSYGFWVDKEKKRLHPPEGESFPTNEAVVNYTWMAPVPVKRQKTISINQYGLHEERYSFSDVTSLKDAIARAIKILDKRSEPFLVGKINTLEELEIGDKIRVKDNLNIPSINEDLVVTKIIRRFPSGYDEIEVGDKEWKLEDDLIEMEERIKRLEERFVLERDYINELRDATNNTEFIKHKCLRVLKGTYDNTKKYLLLGHPTYSDFTEYYLTDPADEDAFEWEVYQSTCPV